MDPAVGIRQRWFESRQRTTPLLSTSMSGPGGRGVPSSASIHAPAERPRAKWGRLSSRVRVWHSRQC
eukprot:5949582-Prymnesium_polylepis.1